MINFITRGSVYYTTHQLLHPQAFLFLGLDWRMRYIITDHVVPEEVSGKSEGWRSRLYQHLQLSLVEKGIHCEITKHCIVAIHSL